MIPTPLRTLGLASAALFACSTTDPGSTATLSGTETITNPTSMSADDGSGGTDDINETYPTTSAGEASQSGGDSTTLPDPATTNDASTGGTDSASASDPQTTDPTLDTDSTAGETGETGGESTDTGETTNDSSDDTTGGVDPNCMAPSMMLPCDAGTNDVFKAIGLNCSDDPTTAIPITNPKFTSPAANAWRVTTHYGSAKDPMDPNKFMWGPKEGERLLAISTGVLAPLMPDGALIKPDFSVNSPNNNPDGLADLPPPMTWAQGSNNGNGGTPFMDCDGVKDCSDTLDEQWNIAPNNEANDVFFMSFDLTVPAGTHGYLFDFAYFSEEWPNFVNQAYNDMLVVWSTSESFTGNVTFIDEQPLTVTALDPYMTIKPGDPLLVGTGFPDAFDGFPGASAGAGTGWFTAKASATPGETFTVAISIFDMGDDILDTIGLIDKFRWDCEGCVPSEVNDCGVQPQ